MYSQMEDDSGGLDRLVASAQRGDDASREELLRLVRAGALRYLLARGLPDHDAQDLAQDTCLGVLRALPRWQDQGRPVWAFVFAVLHNKIADRARSRAERREVPVGPDSRLADTVIDSHPGPEEVFEQDEGAGRVQALLGELPMTQRDVVLLRVVVGLSAIETAQALGLTAGTVRVLQHRAVTQLRNRLATVPWGTA
jgi:RNA polymerase sigma-70 factor (ECF subfamily)